MKKILLLALIAGFVLCIYLPIAGQKRKITPVREIKPTPEEFVSVRSAAAFTDGEGALVRWETSSEKGTLGFFVYRVDDNGRTLASQQMVMGAAAKPASDPANSANYQFFDEKGGIGSAYFVECVGLKGQRLDTAVFTAVYAVDLKAASGFSKYDYYEKKGSATGNIESATLTLPKELYSTVNDAQQAPDLANQRWVVSQQGAKIAVRQTGLYRVTRAELQNAGFDVSTDPSFWRLFTDGNEQAIKIGGSGDYIEFYGSGIDTVESDTRMYYLITGNIAGKRMRTRV